MHGQEMQKIILPRVWQIFAQVIVAWFAEQHSGISQDTYHIRQGYKTTWKYSKVIILQSQNNCPQVHRYRANRIFVTFDTIFAIFKDRAPDENDNEWQIEWLFEGSIELKWIYG